MLPFIYSSLTDKKNKTKKKQNNYDLFTDLTVEEEGLECGFSEMFDLHYSILTDLKFFYDYNELNNFTHFNFISSFSVVNMQFIYLFIFNILGNSHESGGHGDSKVEAEALTGKISSPLNYLRKHYSLREGSLPSPAVLKDLKPVPMKV